MPRLALQAINHQRFPTNDQAEYTDADSTDVRSGHELPRILPLTALLSNSNIEQSFVKIYEAA